jgi:ABC-type dipeptide/oligopeptide/nickel transport system permease subunit
MEKRYGARQEYTGPYNFSTPICHSDNDVWPPVPRGYRPHPTSALKPPAEPQGTFAFFFSHFIGYGIAFGMLYGAPLYIIGAFYGAFFGLILGAFDGFLLGVCAMFLVRRRMSARNVASNVLLLTPVTSGLGGIPLAIVVASWTWNIIAVIFWVLAIVASWHAAFIFTRKFAREYE